jgi:transcriptional regulator with XRE-family HTH domain
MTEGQASEHSRIRLGAELRRLRVLAGLSGTQMAAEMSARLPDASLSQSTLSRAERGEGVLSAGQIAVWCDITGAGEERRVLVVALAEAAVNEVIPHSDRLTAGLAAVQTTVQNLERTAQTLRNFQPGFIPGLLQTAEYARRILTMADPAANVGEAVAARLARQSRLYEPERRHEFLLTEAALRFRPGPGEDVHTGQLDHLAAVVTLSTISFGVIPQGAEMYAMIRCGFILYEDREDDRPAFARVETPHATLDASDPADVQTYRDQLGLLRRSAIYGTDAISFVRSIAHPDA